VVEEPSSAEEIWWGSVNVSISEEKFDRVHRGMSAYLQGKELFVLDCWAGAHPDYRIPIRVINEYAWHNLFARQLFVRPKPGETEDHIPLYTVIDLPHFHADPEIHGTRSEAFVLVHFGKGLVLIGGTSYAGEMKKSIFSILNYILPKQGVLSMHCAANMGDDGDTALFFGLSGTGKTTLSADPKRHLIGDDEHGWTDEGIFNFEGGCYAKTILLSEEREPQIWRAIRFGSVLENVVMKTDNRTIDYGDGSITENTRAAYPVEFIDNAVIPGLGGHPKNILFLTCDAFGVLPPVSKLTPEQAMYHFLSGYTAKVAGTETGITEPQTTFSACFGSPFLPLPPSVYAKLLGERIQKHGSHCWLVNTGWSGGPYGVGERMSLPYTRALVTAILEGALEKVETAPDPIFGVHVPKSCPGVPQEILTPSKTWNDNGKYDLTARKLAKKFMENASKMGETSPEILAAGPKA
jgi:phosphoenolpyruvate carboxykinase (ATP)